MAKRYIRLTQLTEKLSIGARTVPKWVARGLLPEGIKMGRARLWDEDEVDEYIDRLRSQ